MDLENLRKELDKYGQEVVDDLFDELAILDKYASGKLIASLDYRIREILNGYELDILMEDYGQYVDKGRKPGKMPPLEPIKEWTKLKGLPTGLAFPIARKIGMFGIPPTNFIEKALSRSRGKFTEIVSRAAKEDFTKEVTKEIEIELKNNNKKK